MIDLDLLFSTLRVIYPPAQDTIIVQGTNAQLIGFDIGWAMRVPRAGNSNQLGAI